MTVANATMKDHEDVLARLVRDLDLCRVKDYPGVSLEQLNKHVKKLGSLFHPDLGEQRVFFVDEGRFVPFRKVVSERSVTGPAIMKELLEWAELSGHGGSVINAQSEFVLDGTMLRVPDVAYVPRNRIGQLTEAQGWTRGGQPFAPSFVVEMDILAGPHSNLNALDHKMQHEYFPHGVQLGWLMIPGTKSCTSTSDTPEEIEFFDVFAIPRGEILTVVMFCLGSDFAQ